MISVKSQRWQSLVSDFRKQSGTESVLTVEEFLNQYNAFRQYSCIYGTPVEVTAPMRIWFETHGGNSNVDVLNELIKFNFWMNS